MKIEVVYATETEQPIVQLELAEGATVQDAVSASGLATTYSDIKVGETPVGIYSERVQYDTQLRDGDRVEIYRSLQLDPMAARRLRAEAQAAQKNETKTKKKKAD